VPSILSTIVDLINLSNKISTKLSCHVCVTTEQILADRAKALKESAWDGRKGGFDSTADFEIKESLRLLKKKNPLPPIGNSEEVTNYYII